MKRSNDMTPLLDIAVDTHGGLMRWRQIKRIDFKLWIGGGLWKMKGQKSNKKEYVRVPNMH